MCIIISALRAGAIDQKRTSYNNAVSNEFPVGTYEDMIPSADLVINLTPDKNHSSVVEAVMPLMKKGATLSYSHGFNIVEEGMKIREDLTVIMVAPRVLGQRFGRVQAWFWCSYLIAVHVDNDLKYTVLSKQKHIVWNWWAPCCVLESSFVAEVKSDLMGEQTILCGYYKQVRFMLLTKWSRKG